MPMLVLNRNISTCVLKCCGRTLRNNETFPSKHIQLYRSLVKRKYHSYIVIIWIKDAIQFGLIKVFSQCFGAKFSGQWIMLEDNAAWFQVLMEKIWFKSRTTDWYTLAAHHIPLFFSWDFPLQTIWILIGWQYYLQPMRNQIVSRGNHRITVLMVRGSGASVSRPWIKLDFFGDNWWCSCK